METVGAIDITSNKKLSALNAFQKVRVTGRFNIDDSPGIVDISSLDSLIEVHDMYLRFTQLKTLNGLNHLRTINDGWLSIEYNNHLTTLTDLSSLQITGQELVEITDNPLLPECEALALVGDAKLRQYATIRNNDTTATCEEP